MFKKIFKGRLTFSVALVTFILYLAELIYSALALTGHAPLTKSIYLICLFSLAISCILLCGLLWKEGKDRSLSFKIGVILAWGVVSWYWFFSPVYFLFVMNLNDLQLRWGFFSFISQVVILGFIFVLIGIRLFRPVQSALAGKTPPPDVDLYRRVVNYPLTMSLFAFAAGVIGFANGTLQTKYFAYAPAIELWKNFAHGFMVSIFLAVVYYVVLQNLLGSARAAIQRKTKVADPARGSIFRRMLVVFALVVFSSVFLLQLILVRDLQDIVSNSLIGRLELDVTNRKWEEQLIQSGAKTFLLGQDPSLSHQQFAPEVSAFVLSNDSGVISDSNVEPKLVAFFTDPATGQKSILTLSLYDFYGALRSSILFFAGTSLFVFLVSLGIVAIVTSTLTQSIQTLTLSIRLLPKNRKAEVAQVSSGDEIEELSTSLTYFVDQSRDADKAKDEFIAIASHQLRTPLTQLEWILGALKRGDLEKDIKEYFPDIQMSVLHLSELVNLLLNAHRLEENKADLNTVKFELVAFVKAYAAKYRPLAEHKGLKVEVKGDAEVEMLSDKTMIEMILDSLISNAIEYTPKGGSITIAIVRQKDRVLLSFTDTGIGIPEETKAKIFQKFVRAHNALLVKTAGTGLGLYVAKQCVLILGGTIRFESEVDRGTTFYVDLPVRIKTSRRKKF